MTSGSLMIDSNLFPLELEVVLTDSLTPASSFQESWQCAFVAIVITASLFAAASVWRLVRGPIYAARSTDFASSFAMHVLVHVPHADIEVQLARRCNCTSNGDTKVRQKQDGLAKTFHSELTGIRSREGRKEGVDIQCSRMTITVVGPPGI